MQAKKASKGMDPEAREEFIENAMMNARVEHGECVAGVVVNVKEPALTDLI